MAVRFCEEGLARDSRNCLRQMMRPGLCHYQSEWEIDTGYGEIVMVDVGGQEKRKERQWSKVGEWPWCQMHPPLLTEQVLSQPHI